MQHAKQGVRVAFRPFARTEHVPSPASVPRAALRPDPAAGVLRILHFVGVDAGVCLGVAALITIISVMNGFEGELRGRLVALTAHATVTGPPEQMSDWRAVADSALAVPGTVGAAPFVDVQAVGGPGT